MYSIDSESCQDYQRIAAAIQYLSKHQQQQPSLQALAKAIGLSPFHCQRLFQRWAGISPKKFLQYLTVEHAKTLLAQSYSVLDTALETGLSGPGRLHDHFVTVEAMTPGEYKAGGKGLAISYGIHASPFGPILLGVSERGICTLRFLDGQSLQESLDELALIWPQARLLAEQKATAAVAAQIFNNSPTASSGRTLSLLVRATPFQLSVWKALLQIPTGTVCSYAEIARAVDKPNAMRAVGNAIGRNPVGFLIPCHRVLRATGALGGYRWGETRKQAVLAWEAAHLETYNATNKAVERQQALA